MKKFKCEICHKKFDRHEVRKIEVNGKAKYFCHNHYAMAVRIYLK